MAIGYIGILSEKIEHSIQVLEIIEASKRLHGLSKFTFYAIADGLSEVFSKLYTGIAGFFAKPAPSDQRALFDWVKKWGNSKSTGPMHLTNE